MKKIEAGDLFFIIAGALIVALAAAVAFSVRGEVRILGLLLGAAGIALFLAGLLSGGVIGAILGIAAITVLVRLVEVFPLPLAAALGLIGTGLIIFGLKGSD